MLRTLGGDRIGAGKKMQVELHGYERSTHDLSYLWRSTMAAGTIVPFMTELALPGDTFDINLNTHILTHPTIGPLFGSMKVEFHVFEAPIRLYNSWLHNNRLNIGLNMAQVKLPVMELQATVTADATDLDNSQINPSALLSYLGIRGVGITTTGEDVREFNAVPMLAYWEIYKNYYSNKQEEIGACLHTPAVALIETIDTITVDGNAVPLAPATDALIISSGMQILIQWTGTDPLAEQIMITFQNRGTISIADISGFTVVSPGMGVTNPWYGADDIIVNWRYRDVTDTNNGQPSIQTFPLENIDRMRDAILMKPGNEVLNVPNAIETGSTIPYSWIDEQVDGIPSALSSQELLGLKTYSSDMLNNWLSTEWLDGVGGINEITAVSTAGDSFEINTLILSKKVYDMLNRIAVSGGSYNDWLDTVYTENRMKQAESPIYHGGLIKELIFQEVIANTASAEQPQGTIGGRGTLSNKHKGGNITIKCQEPSFIMGMATITPRIDYSQGNKWHVHLKTMDDLHKPGLDGIGFQESINEQRAWWSTQYTGGNWVQTSAGKVPAWLNYMTNVNETRGNFAIATNEMFMTLNRRYEPLGGNSIDDLTTYIDPSKFNHIFAETSLDAQNYWVQVAVDITARRKMSAKLMPNL